MTASVTSDDLLASVAALGPLIRATSDETERSRRVPQSLIEQMLDARLFDMVLPKVYGGLEVDVLTMMRVIEAVSVHDAATGWCVGIGVGTSVVSASMQEKTAREVFTPRTIIGGAQAPLGRATPVEGGFRVNGRWPFASGSAHCSWIVGTCIVFDGDAPRLRDDGMPEMRLMVFPRGEIEILDTWHVSGLRGTGSNDVAVKDIFVPDERALSLYSQPAVLKGPLYQYPVLGFLALTIAPVTSGLARRAIDELMALAARKTPLGSRATLRDRPVAQHEIARAEAVYRSGRAFMYEIAAETWDTVTRGDPPTIKQRALLRLACAYACSSAAQAVEIAYHLGGGTSLYDTSVLQRCLRDVHAATQHVMHSESNFETAGRVLLGNESDVFML